MTLLKLGLRSSGCPGVVVFRCVGLGERLAALGVDDNEQNLRNKVSEGSSRQVFCCNV